MGGTQEGNALKSGIMKATGARPRQVLSEDDIRRRLMKQNEQGIANLKNKLDDPEKKAMGGRIGYKFGTGKKGVQSLIDLISLGATDRGGLNKFKPIGICLIGLINLIKMKFYLLMYLSSLFLIHWL